MCRLIKPHYWNLRKLLMLSPLYHWVRVESSGPSSHRCENDFYGKSQISAKEQRSRHFFVPVLDQTWDFQARAFFWCSLVAEYHGFSIEWKLPEGSSEPMMCSKPKCGSCNLYKQTRKKQKRVRWCRSSKPSEKWAVMASCFYTSKNRIN